jgi:hypothetical protein
MSRGIALLFHDLGTRRGWVVSSTPRPHFAPGKDPARTVQEAGWAPGPVWTGEEYLAPTGIRSPDRPVRSQSLYRLSYPAHIIIVVIIIIIIIIFLSFDSNTDVLEVVFLSSYLFANFSISPHGVHRTTYVALYGIRVSPSFHKIMQVLSTIYCIFRYEINI